MITAYILCQQCKVDVPITVRFEDLEAYHNGALVQDAFPYLTPGEREMIISQTCDRCFDKMWEEA